MDDDLEAYWADIRPRRKRYKVGNDAHPRPLTEEQLDEIEQYELECIHESKLGLRLNGRLVLAMIREIRESRAAGR